MGGGNNSLRFMTNDPNRYNTVGDIVDTVFGTDYKEVL